MSSEEIDPISLMAIPPERRVVIDGNPFNAQELAKLMAMGNWRNPMRTHTLVFDTDLGREIWRRAGRTNRLPAHPGPSGLTSQRQTTLTNHGAARWAPSNSNDSMPGPSTSLVSPRVATPGELVPNFNNAAEVAIFNQYTRDLTALTENADRERNAFYALPRRQQTRTSSAYLSRRAERSRRDRNEMTRRFHIRLLTHREQLREQRRRQRSLIGRLGLGVRSLWSRR